MGSGGQGRLSLHVSCCSVSFFQLLYVSCISMKVSETNTWLEEVGLCSIVVELCGNCAALSGSRQAVCRMPTLMALGKMLREGFDPSAPGEIHEGKNAFVEETEARSGFCLKQSLPCLVHIHSFVIRSTLQRSDAQCFFAHIYIHLCLKAILRADNFINSP